MKPNPEPEPRSPNREPRPGPASTLTDDDLVEGFEAAALAEFPHADHVRLTIVYLARHGRDATLRRMMDGLQRFAAQKGKPEKFHVTMTRAWVEVIELARRAHPDAADARALVAACPELLDSNLLDRFYSPDCLRSDTARLAWVAPDRGPLRLDAMKSGNGPDLPRETGGL
jgi:hypothetical protein